MRARIATSGADARAAEDILRGDGYEVVHGDAVPVDLLVVDEWTAETAPHVRAARASGTRVTVLAELILGQASSPVVGVTGTAGKTSTCRSLESILMACGRPVAISSTARSGNAWPDHSLAEQVSAGLPPGAVVVAELTSTHLCHMDRVHPDVAVVTTIRPDHLELHGGYDAYVASKRRLVAELTSSDALVLPTDDDDTVAAMGPVPARRWGFGSRQSGDGAFAGNGVITLVAPSGQARIPTLLEGPPLRAALAAGAAALALGLDAGDVGAAMAGIGTVAHRQCVHEGPRGIRVVDDSMAATPLKGAAAVERFAGPGLVVVLGGDDALAGEPVHAHADEQAALRHALRVARDAAAAVVAFGPARARITPQIAVDVQAESLSEALEEALLVCPDGGTLLVSPMFPLTPEEREHAAAFG